MTDAPILREFFDLFSCVLWASISHNLVRPPEHSTVRLHLLGYRMTADRVGNVIDQLVFRIPVHCQQLVLSIDFEQIGRDVLPRSCRGVCGIRGSFMFITWFS